MSRSLVPLLLLAALPARAISLDELPAPGPGRWVIDLTGRVPAEDVAAANALAERAARRDLGRIAVLVVDTTHGQPPRRFAEEVHERWAFDGARGNGILFFVALSDRKAETLLPWGLRDRSDQRLSDEAMANVIVPAFKRGAVGEGVREGTAALARLLEQSPSNAGRTGGVEHRAPVATAEPQRPRAVRAPEDLPLPQGRGFFVDAARALLPPKAAEIDALLNGFYAEHGGKLYVYLVRSSDFGAGSQAIAELLLRRHQASRGKGVQVAVLTLDRRAPAIAGWALSEHGRGWAMDLLLEETEDSLLAGDLPGGLSRFVKGYEDLVTRGPAMSDYPARAHARLAAAVERNAPLVGLTLAAGLGGGLFGLSRYLRVRRRRCKTCGEHRLRLDERGDDEHLSQGQQHEEQLGSVDYDVWWCGRCEDALVLRYRAFFTRYKSCPRCDFVCAMQSTRTLVQATYESGGQVEVTLSCTRCGHHSSQTRYTPRLQRSRTGQGRSFGSSSGGGRSYGGSSGSW